LINKDELKNTFETEQDYILFEKGIQKHDLDPSLNAKKTRLTDEFTSDQVSMLSKEELKEILLKEKLIQK